MEMLTKNKDAIVEEKSKLALIEINEKEYNQFEKDITPFLVKIGEDALKILK